MKKEWLLSSFAAAGLACLLIAATSCEWDRADDESTWNDAYESKYEWVNFSGVYQQTSGWYVVSQFRRPNTGSSSAGSDSGNSGSIQSITIGTGNNVQYAFGGTVTDFGGHLPIMPGTVSARAQLALGQTETLVDRNRDGFLYSSIPTIDPVTGTERRGSINYFTGSFSIPFHSAVNNGAAVYLEYLIGSPYTTNNVVVPVAQRPRPGSTQPIYQFLIFQDGYRLRLTDNYGTVYEGRIITIQSTAGGVSTDIRPGEAVPVIASFEASGDGVTMSGTLEGTYTAAAEDTTYDPNEAQNPTQNQTTDYRGTMDNRIIRGVWVEDSGITGEIEGVATAPVVINPD